MFESRLLKKANPTGDSTTFELQVAPIKRTTNMEYWSNGAGKPYTYTPGTYSTVVVQFPAGVDSSKAVQILAKACGYSAPMNKREHTYYSPSNAEFNKKGYGSVIVSVRREGTTSENPILAVEANPEFDRFVASLP